MGLPFCWSVWRAFQEFNVQYYHPSAPGAALHSGEAAAFAGAVEDVLAKQAKVIESLEQKATHASLMSGDRVTQRIS